MEHDLSIGCRLLAVVAWAAALAWFALATVASWGFTPGSLLLWTVPAWPLLRLTLDRWGRVGRPLAPAARARLERAWRALALASLAYHLLIMLVGAVAGDARWFEVGFGWTLLVLGAVCGAFPAAVSGWAVWRTLRLRAA